MTKPSFNPSNIRWLKSQPFALHLHKDQIDKEKGILHDVVMCQTGPAKGHGVYLEQDFINSLVAYDVEHFSEKGLKARFGHPSMSDTTMGTQLGVFKNFRTRDNQAIADLHLLESSNVSPTKPGMKNWILSMASEKPDFIMMSIAFKDDGYYQYNDEGEKVDAFDDDGQLKYNDREIFVTLGEHFYTDMVEQGAATDSLFSAEFNKDKFAVQAVEFLQENPEIHDFLKANPQKLTEFAEKAGIPAPNAEVVKSKTLLEQIKQLFTASEKEEPKPEIDLTQYVSLNEHNSEIALYEENIERLSGHIDQLTADHQNEILIRDNRIKELEEKHRAEVTQIPLESAAPAATAAYLLDTNTQKAIQKQQKK